MHQRNLIVELAKALDKSEEEVRQFLEALWQRLPLFVEVEPPFVRFLEARIEHVHSLLEATIEGLRTTMEQGFTHAKERDEAILREMGERIEALRREMQQGFQQAAERDEALRREMQQTAESLRREMQQGFQQAAERDEALRREMQQGFQQAAERDEALRREIWQTAETLRREMDALRREMLAQLDEVRAGQKRLERLFYGLFIPLTLLAISVAVQILG